MFDLNYVGFKCQKKNFHIYQIEEFDLNYVGFKYIDYPRIAF